MTTPGSPDGFSPSPAGAAAGAAHARGRSSDAFEDEDGRQAHFSGEVAQALAQNAELVVALACVTAVCALLVAYETLVSLPARN